MLTNAIDGPAEELAHGLVKLVDARADAARRRAAPAGGRPAAALLHRPVRRPVGHADVVELGGRLVLVRPTAPDPLPGMEELQVVDARTLRVAAQPGFGAAGELVHLERDADGAVASVRLGGVTYRPMAEFLRRREAAARGPVADLPTAATGRSAP